MNAATYFQRQQRTLLLHLLAWLGSRLRLLSCRVELHCLSGDRNLTDVKYAVLHKGSSVHCTCHLLDASSEAVEAMQAAAVTRTGAKGGGGGAGGGEEEQEEGSHSPRFTHMRSSCSQESETGSQAVLTSASVAIPSAFAPAAPAVSLAPCIRLLV